MKTLQPTETRTKSKSDFIIPNETDLELYNRLLRKYKEKAIKFPDDVSIKKLIESYEDIIKSLEIKQR